MPPAETPKVLSAEPGAPKHHWSLDVAFPAYAMAFVDDNTIILGGGGGSSRTGVKNRLVSPRILLTTEQPRVNQLEQAILTLEHCQCMHTIDLKKRQFLLATEYELSKTEDAPMSIAVLPETQSLVAGINSDAQTLARGKNENVRVFTYNDHEIIFEKRRQTLATCSEDHYQKVTAFARTKPYLHMIAIGSTDSHLSVLTFPELQEILPPIEYEGEELFDVDFHDDAEMVLGASATKLCVWPTKRPSDKSIPLEALQVIERPVLNASLACTFRAAKFGRRSTKDRIYTVVNAAPKNRSKKPGKAEKKSFVSMWDAKEWKLIKTRTVSMKPLTAFDISDDGTMLAYGSSDLSVGVLDAETLRPIVTILHAHSFPVTSLKFSPSGHIVVSGSADNSVRIIDVPPRDQRGKGGRGMVWNVVLTLLVLLVAIWLQQQGWFAGEEVKKVARSVGV